MDFCLPIRLSLSFLFQYTIKSEMKTGLLKKDKLEQVEFFVEYPPVVPEDLVNSKYVDFSLEPEKLKIKDVCFYFNSL